MQFVFKAIGPDGKIVNSIIKADTKEAAIFTLEKKNLRLINIEEKQYLSDSHPGLNALLGKSRKKMLGSGKLTNQTLFLFFEKLQKMLAGGLTLSDAISSINKRTTNIAEKKLTDSLLADISAGEQLSVAIKKLSANIDATIYSIILVGESSGNLATVLIDVVELLKFKNELKQQMASSLTYPAFMTAFTFVIILLFSFVLMPKMEGLLASFGAGMPPIAKFLKVLSKCFMLALPALICAVIGGIIFIPRLRKTDIGRHQTDGLILKIPPFSSIIPLSVKTNLTNLMSTLLANGVNIIDALALAKNSIINSVFLERFSLAEAAIMEGETVCEAFESNKILDGDSCDFLEVGEKTGDLASSFKYVYKIYNGRLNNAVKKMKTSITTIAMLFAFSLIGLLAMGIVQSMLGMATAVS